jgi:3-oxoacyl-[acyl-carrier protein] reductase
MAVQCDLSRTPDIDAMVAKIRNELGPIQILVNSAGVFEYKSLPQITDDHFHALFNTSVHGLLIVTKTAVAYFDGGGGSVVNVSSPSALGNSPGRAVYAASKAAVNAITNVLALELAPRRIRVNGIMPGYYDTEEARAFGLPGSEAERLRPLRSGPAGRRISARSRSVWHPPRPPG